MVEAKHGVGVHTRTHSIECCVNDDEEDPTNTTTATGEPDEEDMLPIAPASFIARSADQAVSRVTVSRGHVVNDVGQTGHAEAENLLPSSAAFRCPARDCFHQTVPTVMVSGEQITCMPPETNGGWPEKLCMVQKVQNCCTKSRHWMWLGLSVLLLLIVVGGVVGAVFGTTMPQKEITFEGSGESRSDDFVDEVFVEQIDPVLNGKPGSMYGSSVSINIDGM